MFEKEVSKKLETLRMSVQKKQTVVADAQTIDKRVIFEQKFKAFQKNFVRELNLLRSVEQSQQCAKECIEFLAKSFERFCVTKEVS